MSSLVASSRSGTCMRSESLHAAPACIPHAAGALCARQGPGKAARRIGPNPSLAASSCTPLQVLCCKPAEACAHARRAAPRRRALPPTPGRADRSRASSQLMRARRARPARLGLPFVEPPAAQAPTPAGVPACLSLAARERLPVCITSPSSHRCFACLASEPRTAGRAVRQPGMGRVNFGAAPHRDTPPAAGTPRHCDVEPGGARRAGSAWRTLRSLLGHLLGRRPEPRAAAPPPAPPPPSPPTPAAAAPTTTPAAVQAGAAAVGPPAAASEAALPAAAALADAPPAAPPAPATPLLGLMAADASGLPLALRAPATELAATAAPGSGPAPAPPAAEALADAPDSALPDTDQPTAAVVREALLAAEVVVAGAAAVPAERWAPPTPERPAGAPAGKHAGVPAAASAGPPAGAPGSEPGQGGLREWPLPAVPKPTENVRPPRAHWAAGSEERPGVAEWEPMWGGLPPAQAPVAPKRSLSPAGPPPWPAAARKGSPERGGKRVHGGEGPPEPGAGDGGWTDRGLWPGRGSSPADWLGESSLTPGPAGAPLVRPGYTLGAAGPEDEWAVGEGAGATSPPLGLQGSARGRSAERALPSTWVRDDSPAGGAPAEDEFEPPRPCSLPGAVVLLTEGAAGEGWGDEAGAALPEGGRWGAGPASGSPRFGPLASSPPPLPRGWDERAAHAPRGAERAGERPHVAATGGASSKADADAGAMGRA
jgi:hypothetical protein